MSQPIIFTQSDYEIKQREVLYEGFQRLVRYHLRHRQFNGEWSTAFTREIAERVSAAAILPYDPILDRVVLIEQFRAGAVANPESPWLIEIIAGLLDHENNPIAVATREAEEEGGCTLLDIYKIYAYFVSPGGSNEFLNVYVGRVDASDVGGIYGLANEHEDIRAFTLSLDEAYEWVQTGKILTAPAIISIQWLQLNKAWLKQLWQTK